MQFAKAIPFILLLFATPAAAQDTVKPAKLISVSTSEIDLERQFFGKVAARETVDLAFQVAGQVVDLPVREGQTLKAGDLIARLDQVPFRLRLDQAQLQKDQADRDLARKKKLEGSTVSEATLQDAETAAGLAAIALRDAQWALDHSELRAPFDGLVSSRTVELFATVGAGAPVVRMHDMSELRIQVDVPEILFQQAERSEHVKVSARFPASPESFPLTIREFDAETSNVGQTFRVTFGMAPPEGLNILPGASATVTIKARQHDQGIVIPPTALVMNDAGKPGVMRFAPAGADQGTVTWAPVEITPVQSGAARVVSGLSDGDEIVLAGGGALENGQTVRRFTGFAN